MKRLLILLATILLAVSASASLLDERDMLLTRDGIVYSVEVVERDSQIDIPGQHLRVTVQQGEDRTSVVVPGTEAGGIHGQPALAYDEDSRTLFVFWQEQLSRGLASRLLFASFRDGACAIVQSIQSCRAACSCSTAWSNAR